MFADDKMIFAQSQKDIVYTTDTLNDVFEKWEMKINIVEEGYTKEQGNANIRPQTVKLKK